MNDKQDPRRTLFNRDDLREFRGAVYVDKLELDELNDEEQKKLLLGKIDGMEREYQHWKQRYEQETFEPQKEIYKDFAEIAKLQADKMRLENNIKPSSEEGIKILNEETDASDLSRLERFKNGQKKIF